MYLNSLMDKYKVPNILLKNKHSNFQTCIDKLSHTAYSKKGFTQYPMHTNGDKVSHVCRSTNFTGRSCQNIGQDRTENDCGDSENKMHSHAKKKLGTKISKSTQNFASGDYTERVNKTQKIFGNNYDVTRKINKESSHEKRQNRGLNTDATTVKYRNENYDESKSITTDSSLCNLIKNNLLNNDITEFNHDMQDTQAIRRPVFCPVSNCAKLVAIDSIMSHFYFDHSRVPRITLIKAEPEDIFLKSNISSEPECIAMTLIEILGRSSKISQNSDCVSYVNRLNHNNKLLLLMAVKLKISAVKISERDSKQAVKLSKHDDPKLISKRNKDTQTNKIDFNKYIEITKNHTKVYKTDCKLNINKPEHFDNDDIVLIWLCKLDDEEKTYTIIMTREGHKLSYGYTGDAIHIQESQDPLSIYKRPECLMVRGSAINKLSDTDNIIKIIVNCID